MRKAFAIDKSVKSFVSINSTLLINKIETIEKCLKRIDEEANSDCKNNFTHQDALILNLERACQASIDIASYLVKQKKPSAPKFSSEVFQLLADNQITTQSLSDELQRMVGFRNVTVHDYSNLNLDILNSILTHHLPSFRAFTNSVFSSHNKDDT